MKQYADYFLLLSPNEHVNEVVQTHKQYAEGVIGRYDSQHAQAHISLKQMQRQKAFVTEPVLRSLEKTMITLPPVTFTIDGFDYFDHGNDFKTIYAKLRSNQNTGLWFRQLKKHLLIKEFMVPHITIARNIPVKSFNKLWPHFKSLNWVEQFTVTELTILQRETFATFGSWEPFMTLPFGARRLIEPEAPKTIAVKRAGKVETGQMRLF